VREDVRSSFRWARRSSPKSSRRLNLGLLRHPSWESGCLGHANALRGLPKYEETKRLGTRHEGRTKVGSPSPKGHDG
jgi:hypothetical protein